MRREGGGWIGCGVDGSVGGRGGGRRGGGRGGGVWEVGGGHFLLFLHCYTFCLYHFCAFATAAFLRLLHFFNTAALVVLSY